MPIDQLDGLRTALESFVLTHPDNRLPEHPGMRLYQAPLVAVADADDALFLSLTAPSVVGPQHLTPGEWLPTARRVVAMFLPFTEDIRRTNRPPGLPSQEWMRARGAGEEFNRALRLHCIHLLESWGAEAVAPALTQRFAVHERRSNWSERHVGYIAGLGSFGLNRTLITARGGAGRLASVVTSHPLPVTPRTAQHLHQACPYVQSQECGECIPRCPVGAISGVGTDLARCAAYYDGLIKPRFAPDFGCAKCQVGVACEACTPSTSPGSGRGES